MDLQKAREKAARYCAYQERAPHEVEEKLSGFGLDLSSVRKIMHELKKEGFFDEARFTRAYIAGKLRNNKWGKIRIRQNLMLKKLPASLVEQALNEIPEEEYIKTATALIQAKSKTLHEPDNYIRRNKIAVFLIGKGFEPDIVWDLIREHEDS